MASVFILVLHETDQLKKTKKSRTVTLYISLPQKREDKKKNEEFYTKPCKTRSENMVEKQNPQERNFLV